MVPGLALFAAILALQFSRLGCEQSIASPCELQALDSFKTANHWFLHPANANFQEKGGESCLIVGDLRGFHNALLGAFNYRYGNLRAITPHNHIPLLPRWPVKL